MKALYAFKVHNGYALYRTADPRCDDFVALIGFRTARTCNGHYRASDGWEMVDYEIVWPEAYPCGHPWTEENTQRNIHGQGRCKTCNRLNARRAARDKAQANREASAAMRGDA